MSSFKATRVRNSEIKYWPVKSDRPNFSAKFEIKYFASEERLKCLVCNFFNLVVYKKIKLKKIYISSEKTEERSYLE